MKIVTTIPQSSLEKLSKYSRMFSYLMTSFTKTYGIISKDTFILYFKGNKSVVSLSLPLEDPCTEELYFSIDINKFLSAAKKLGTTLPLKLAINTSPPSMLLTSDTTNDKILFSITFYEPGSPEITTLLTFREDKKPLFSTGEVFKATSPFLDFIHIASTYMGTINKNNSIALFNDKLVYADRTVVVNMNTQVWVNPIPLNTKNDYRLLHKFILGFIEFVASENNTFTLSSDKNLIYWVGSDPAFWAILTIDPCTITIPNQEDLNAIIPEDTSVQTITVKPSQLTEAINFFSGLFETSIWKPITFNWISDTVLGQKILLSYKHPSTEIEKDLVVESFDGNMSSIATSFTLISDSLRILLNHMSDTDGTLTIRFNDLPPDVLHGAGIYLVYTNSQCEKVYEAVLAKLSEN